MYIYEYERLNQKICLMKVLFSDTTYSYIFPGGKQVHAEKLFSNLNQIGINVEYENWHNPFLEGDVVHFFGFNDFSKIAALKKKGYKLVYTHIMDGLTNKSKSIQNYHVIKNKIIKYLPNKFNTMFPWRALNYFDAIIYMHQNDRDTAVKIYNVDPEKTFIIPHAVDSIEKFQGDCDVKEEKFLVSVGSIVPRKNSLLTADLCKKYNIPIVFIGPSSKTHSKYFEEFMKKVDGKKIKYLGYISEEEKIDILKRASGFVLLSFGESGCISIYEAGASGLPLLLSDLPWAKGYEAPNDMCFCNLNNEKEQAEKFVNFYKGAKRKEHPSFKIYTWREIALKYAAVYSSLFPKKI